MRTEPPVSLPSATSASSSATATADPLLDPPGIRAGSSGFTGLPNHGLVPIGIVASSCRLVLPTMRAPAALAPARHGASAAAGRALRSKAGEPPVVGTPSMSMMSLTASRGPSPVVSNFVMKVLMQLRVAHASRFSDAGRASRGQVAGNGYRMCERDQVTARHHVRDDAEA